MLWSVANMLWSVANRPQHQRTLAAWRCASPLWAREQSLRHLPMIFRGGSHEASYPRVVYVQYIQYCTKACVLYTSVSMNNVALNFSQLESKLERVVLASCLRGSPLPGCRAPAAGARVGSVLAAAALGRPSGVRRVTGALFCRCSSFGGAAGTALVLHSNRCCAPAAAATGRQGQFSPSTLPLHGAMANPGGIR